jgi:hypothetical protein
MKTLRPIPTPHPAIVIGALVILAAALYWSFQSHFREPSLWVSSAITMFVILANEASRRSRSRIARPLP